ncbi:MAG: hypothetical protein U1G07_21615 [Verrucomicrobiota bacterium]
MAATWLAAAALVMVGCGRDPETSGPSPSELAKRQFDAKVAQLEARERQMDETVWAKRCWRRNADRFSKIWRFDQRLDEQAGSGGCVWGRAGAAKHLD